MCPGGVSVEGRLAMLMLFKVVMTISVVWFMAGLVGLIFKSNGMRPNFLMGLAVLLTAALVGYMWDIGNLLYR
jgi:NADH:ubiquinone oxidoreductase subunit K